MTSALFFWAFLPETKGLNLEDMDDLFYNSPTFVPGSHWKPSSHLDSDAAEAKEQEESDVGTGKVTYGSGMPSDQQVEKVDLKD